MASKARKKITLIDMRKALIELGHDELWWRAPVPKGNKQGVCEIVTWDDYVVARKDLDVHTKGWDFTKNATVIFPCPQGCQPSRFDDVLDDVSAILLCTVHG
ncbi:TPA: hypothetical protein NPP35_004408 [Klebsiella variicola subsp. variicola]|nr:hypothetical protein [Klebsiella variicola subsp. variicola]